MDLAKKQIVVIALTVAASVGGIALAVSQGAANPARAIPAPPVRAAAFDVAHTIQIGVVESAATVASKDELTARVRVRLPDRTISGRLAMGATQVAPGDRVIVIPVSRRHDTALIFLPEDYTHWLGWRQNRKERLALCTSDKSPPLSQTTGQPTGQPTGQDLPALGWM